MFKPLIPRRVYGFRLDSGYVTAANEDPNSKFKCKSALVKVAQDGYRPLTSGLDDQSIVDLQLGQRNAELGVKSAYYKPLPMPNVLQELEANQRYDPQPYNMGGSGNQPKPPKGYTVFKLTRDLLPYPTKFMLKHKETGQVIKAEDYHSQHGGATPVHLLPQYDEPVMPECSLPRDAPFKKISRRSLSYLPRNTEN